MRRTVVALKKARVQLTDAQLIAQELRVIRLELKNINSSLQQILCQMDEDCRAAGNRDDDSLI